MDIEISNLEWEMSAFKQFILTVTLTMCGAGAAIYFIENSKSLTSADENAVEPDKSQDYVIMYDSAAIQVTKMVTKEQADSFEKAVIKKMEESFYSHDSEKLKSLNIKLPSLTPFK